MQPKIIIHGGAWDIPADQHESHRRGIEHALKIGISVLTKTDDALQTVIAIIKDLEDNPVFDAGKGSFLNENGEVEMDAGIMVGKDLSVGAVAGIRHVKNPIVVANLVRTQTQHVMLTGEGAEKFAREQGIAFTATSDLLVGRERELYHELQTKKSVKIKSFFEMKQPSDTVGAAVMNSTGHIVAGTSTGGTPFKKAGRVGDSPIIGAGFYADDAVAGVSTTGWGEGILRVLLAREAAEQVESGLNVQQAANNSIAVLQKKVKGDGGLIIIDKNGNFAFAHNTPYMVVGAARSNEIEYVKMSSSQC